MTKKEIEYKRIRDLGVDGWKIETKKDQERDNESMSIAMNWDIAATRNGNAGER